MLEAALIAFVILVYTFQSFLCKNYSDNYPGSKENASPTFTIVSGSAVVVASFFMSGFNFDPSPITVVLGIVNAVALTGYNYFIIKCSQNGPYSVLMVFNLAGGIAMPSVSALIFGDEMSVPKAISVLVIFVAVYMVSRKTDEEKSATRSFILCCTALFVCNGSYGSIFDMGKRLTDNESNELIAITYGLAVLFSAIMLVCRERKGSVAAFRQNRRSLVFLLACSVVLTTAINALVFVLTLVDSTLLFTFDNAGVLLLSVLASRVFFGERMSAVNWIGCVIMSLAMVGVAYF